MIIGFGVGVGFGGGRGATTAITAPVSGSAPVIAVVGGGDPVVGVTLRLESYGSWTGYPLPYALQWRVGGVAVAGATGPEFVTAGRAAAESVTCLVSVTNAAGTDSMASGAVVLTAAPAAVPAATGRLGLGLNGINDWSTAYPFVNVFKTARDWGGDPVLGADGYPTSLPNGPAQNYLLTEINADAASFAGRYRLSWAGTGTMEVQFAGGQTSGANWIEFDFSPNPNVIVGIRILTTSAGDPVRDIALVHTRDLALHAAGVVWNPQYVNVLRGARQIRFMDMQRTNWSEQIDFADVTPVSYYTYARPGGVPIEHMVALANMIGADPWFCIPHQATDAYVVAFATYVRDNLAPALKAHFEYSNEVWNFQFGQTSWLQAQATTRWGGGGDQWMQFAGMRAAQIFDIIGTVYGASRAARVVRVAGQHTGWQGLEGGFLDAPLWVAEGNAAPVTRFDAYAITGYFYGDLIQESKSTVFAGWISASLTAATNDADAAGLTGAGRAAYIEAHKYDLVHANMYHEALDGSVDGGGGSIANITGPVWAYHRGVATARNLQLLMYEGGSHILGYGVNQDNPEVTDVLVSFAATQHMAELYRVLLTAWESVGDGPFQHFWDVSRHTRFGCWGGWRYLEDPAPRAALLATYRDGGSIVAPPVAAAPWVRFAANSGVEGYHLPNTQAITWVAKLRKPAGTTFAASEQYLPNFRRVSATSLLLAANDLGFNDIGAAQLFNSAGRFEVGGELAIMIAIDAANGLPGGRACCAYVNGTQVWSASGTARTEIGYAYGWSHDNQILFTRDDGAMARVATPIDMQALWVCVGAALDPVTHWGDFFDGANNLIVPSLTTGVVAGVAPTTYIAGNAARWASGAGVVGTHTIVGSVTDA